MLTATDLLYFKRRLEETRNEILARMTPQRIPSTDLNELADDVDLAAEVERQNFAEQMFGRDRKILIEVEDAIKRIETGEFGCCEGSGEEISRKRLEIQPWCRYTVVYQEKLEKITKRGRGINDEG